MKTAITEGLEFLDKEIKFITVHDSQEDKYYQAGLKHAYNIFKEKLTPEKDQIKRAFNVGGTEAYEISSDDYYNHTFSTTNKETLK